jgi:hypothetical protein
MRAGADALADVLASLGGDMQLRADGFGCVPDGRVLKSVKVLAGSTRLDVLDGTVRPGDVGKRIAVPVPWTWPPRSPGSSAGKTAQERWRRVATN